jgi:DNA-directed RNA polymerase subunit RPC12/RpoP
MDIIFNCPKCDQELAVDSAGAGSEINCPTCGEKIVVPQAPSHVPGSNIAGRDAAHPVNPIASSAAARVEMHLKVPVRDKPSESLIARPLVPLEAAAKDTSKHVRTKTIRHTDCIEVGHDKFDEIVSKFLEKVGEENIISINTLNYTHLDIGTQKLLTEFGVLIVYRG